MRSAPEIETIWRHRGILPCQSVIFYCGTGWRASEAFFYAWVMGWPEISVYDGGWYEWSQQVSSAAGNCVLECRLTHNNSLEGAVHMSK